MLSRSPRGLLIIILPTAYLFFTWPLADHAHLWTGEDIFSEPSKKLCRHTQVSGLRYGMAKILYMVEAILAR